MYKNIYIYRYNTNVFLFIFCTCFRGIFFFCPPTHPFSPSHKTRATRKKIPQSSNIYLIMCSIYICVCMRVRVCVYSVYSYLFYIHIYIFNIYVIGSVMLDLRCGGGMVAVGNMLFWIRARKANVYTTILCTYIFFLFFIHTIKSRRVKNVQPENYPWSLRRVFAI